MSHVSSLDLGMQREGWVRGERDIAAIRPSDEARRRGRLRSTNIDWDLSRKSFRPWDGAGGGGREARQIG